jgi:hypothetical protein
MDLEEALSVDSSRAMMDVAATAVGNNCESFREAFDLMSSGKRQVAMRAARVVDIASENFPELLLPYLDTIIESLAGLKNNSVKRCMLHSLHRYTGQISGEKLGLLVDCCFTWLPMDTEDISVRYYSMDILYSITKNNPDLKHELALIIEDMMPFASKGLKTKGRKILKEIQREQL